MKRSTLIAIIIIFLSVVIGGVLGFYFYLNSSSNARNQFGAQNVNTGSASFGTPSVNTSVILPGNASSTQPEQTPAIVPVKAETIPTLRQIHKDPVAGAGFFIKDIYATTSPLTETVVVANGTTSTTTTRIIKPGQNRLVTRIEIMQFMERATGHMYETASNTLATIRVSNTTLPKIYEASLLSTSTAIIRGLYSETDTIQTRFASLRSLSPTSTERTLVTKDLPQNLAQVSVSPNKNKIFYLRDEKPMGMISNTDGTNIVTIFDSPYKEWITAWPNEKTVTITTKATGFAEGFMYSINTTSMAMRKVIGNIIGLTTLMSPDGNKVAYSMSEGGSPNLYVLDTQTNTVRNVFLRTFAEKCVWSNKEADMLYCAVPKDIAFGDYPDAWYQGLIFFSDEIWKINTKTGQTRLIAELEDMSDQPIDVTNPVLNPNETYLMFNNKKDLSLWGLQMATIITSATTTATSSTATTTRR